MMPEQIRPAGADVSPVSPLPRTGSDIDDGTAYRGAPQQIVELKQLVKAYGDVLAVDHVELSLREGEFFSLLGPSGCGKTTTLRLIGGFERPTSGSILIQGSDVARTPPHKRPVNTVFQSYALFTHLNVADNVAFGLRERRLAKAEIRRKVAEALDLVRLSGLGERRPRELSGGQQQRVALARAIVNRPALLLLDEPLGALDLKLRRAMQLELTQLQNEVGVTFLYVTHDQEEAFAMSDRIGVMKDGRLEQVGTPRDLYDTPATRYVADFVGEANVLHGRFLQRRDRPLATVMLRSGQEVLASVDDRPLAPSQPVHIVIRPERIDLDTGASDGPNLLSGVVTTTVFTGAQQKLLIHLETGDTVAVARTNSRDIVAGPGDTVTVQWKGEDAWITTT